MYLIAKGTKFNCPSCGETLVEARQDVTFELKKLVVDTVAQLYDVTKMRNIKGVDNKEITCPRCKSNGINLEEEIRKMFKLPCN